MRRNLTLLAAGALATGLIAAGCGGDDDGDEGSDGEALTKQEWIAEADEICRTDSEEIAEAGADIQSREDAEAFISEVLVPELQEEIDELRDLGAPAGDEDEVEAILDAAQEGLDEIEADPQRALAQRNPLAEASALAREYGLKVCGQT